MTINEENIQTNDKAKVNGNLTDFVEGVDEQNKLQIEVAVKDDGRCAVFYNKPFKEIPAYVEFDLNTYHLDFVLENGDTRNSGMPLTKDMSKNMQNTHQILMVLMDDETGGAKEGRYLPLILHGK